MDEVHRSLSNVIIERLEALYWKMKDRGDTLDRNTIYLAMDEIQRLNQEAEDLQKKVSSQALELLVAHGELNGMYEYDMSEKNALEEENERLRNELADYKRTVRAYEERIGADMRAHQYQRTGAERYLASRLGDVPPQTLTRSSHEEIEQWARHVLAMYNDVSRRLIAQRQRSNELEAENLSLQLGMLIERGMNEDDDGDDDVFAYI